MSKPFEAAIETLRFMGPKYSEDYSSAIRVLEAAGMMSKERHLTHFVEETSHVKCYYCTAIRTLLAALPDEVKK